MIHYSLQLLVGFTMLVAVKASTYVVGADVDCDDLTQ